MEKFKKVFNRFFTLLLVTTMFIVGIGIFSENNKVKAATVGNTMDSRLAALGYSWGYWSFHSTYPVYYDGTKTTGIYYDDLHLLYRDSNSTWSLTFYQIADKGTTNWGDVQYLRNSQTSNLQYYIKNSKSDYIGTSGAQGGTDYEINILSVSISIYTTNGYAKLNVGNGKATYYLTQSGTAQTLGASIPSLKTSNATTINASYTTTYTGSAISLSSLIGSYTGFTLSGTTTATNAGIYIATAKLQSGYKWSDDTTSDKSILWSISQADIGSATYKDYQNQIYQYSGSAITPLFTLSYGGTYLKPETDYTVSYTNNIYIGIATVTITGQGNFTGSRTQYFYISKGEQTFTYSNQSISVLDGSLTLTPNGNYASDAFTYSSSDQDVASISSSGVITAGNKVGSTTITVTNAGNDYYNSKTVTFTLTTTLTNGYYIGDLKGSNTCYKTLNEAVAAASAGDTIYVKGNNTLSSDFTIDKNITIKGIDSNAKITISEANVGIRLNDGVSLTLDTLTFDGNNLESSKAFITNSENKSNTLASSSVNYINFKNTANTSSVMNLMNAEVTLTNGSFKNNSGVNGGAIYLDNSKIAVTGSEFSSNTATLGGAIYAKDSTVTLNSGTIKDNTSTDKGNGIYLLNSKVNLDSTDNTKNITDEITIDSSSSVTLTGTISHDIYLDFSDYETQKSDVAPYLSTYLLSTDSQNKDVLDYIVLSNEDYTYSLIDDKLVLQSVVQVTIDKINEAYDAIILENTNSTYKISDSKLAELESIKNEAISQIKNGKDGKVLTASEIKALGTTTIENLYKAASKGYLDNIYVNTEYEVLNITSTTLIDDTYNNLISTIENDEFTSGYDTFKDSYILTLEKAIYKSILNSYLTTSDDVSTKAIVSDANNTIDGVTLSESVSLDDAIKTISDLIEPTKLSIEKNRATVEITAAYNNTKNDTTKAVYDKYLDAESGINTLSSIDDVLLNKEKALTLIKFEALKKNYETELASDPKKDEKISKVEKIIATYPSKVDSLDSLDAVKKSYDECTSSCNETLASYDSNTFKTTYKNLLDKDNSTITATDLDSINTALADYETYNSSSQEGSSMAELRANLLEKKKVALKATLEATKTIGDTKDIYVNNVIDEYIAKIDAITNFDSTTNSTLDSIKTDCTNASTLEAYKTSVISALQSDAKLTDLSSDEAKTLLEKYSNDIRNEKYDSEAELSTQKSSIDEVKSTALSKISDQLKVDSAKATLDSYSETDDNDEVKALISNGKVTLQNLVDTSNDLDNDISTTLISVKTSLDEKRNTLFENYKSIVIKTLNNKVSDNDSTEAKKVISDAVESINALTYTNSKTLKSQEDEIDTIVSSTTTKLDNQKTIDSYKALIQAYKVDGDDSSVDTIIDDAITSLQALIDSNDIESECKNVVDSAKLAIEKIRAKATINKAYETYEVPTTNQTTIKDNYVTDSTGLIDKSTTISEVELKTAQALAKLKIETLKAEISATLDNTDVNYNEKVSALNSKVDEYINTTVDSKTTISDVEALYDTAKKDCNDLVNNYDKNKFYNAHKTLFDKALSDIKESDLTEINNAITDFNINYSEASQEALKDTLTSLLNMKKEALKDSLDNLKTNDSNVNKVIEEYKTKIDSISIDENTSSNLDSLLAEGKVAISFEEYKSSAISTLESMLDSNSSDEAKTLLDSAKESIRNTKYNNTISLDQQKSSIDSLKDNESAKITKQLTIDSYKAQIKETTTSGDKSNEEKEKALAELQKLYEKDYSTEDLQKALDSLLDEGKTNIAVSNVKDLNPSIDTNFNEVKSSDLDSLKQTLKYINSLINSTDPESQKVLAKLNEEAQEEGYSNITNLVKDKVAKATYEGAKEEAITEITSEVRAHDGKRVTDILASVTDDIESNYNYEKYTKDDNIDENLSGEIDTLNNGMTSAVGQIQVGQKQEQVDNQLTDNTTKKIDSRNYNDKQKAQLNDILADSQEKIDNIDKTKSVEEQKAELNQILTDTEEALKDVKVTSVTQGDIYSDKTSTANGTDLAEYGETKTEVWGIVSNDSGLDSDIVLKIEETENDSLKDIQKAAKSNKVTFSDDADYTLDDVSNLIDNKDVKGTLDIYLLQDNIRIESFEGYYIVKILLDESMRDTEGLQVVYMTSDGAVEIYKTTIEDGKFLVFTTSHFSEFVILGKMEDKLVNLWWLIISLLVIAMIEVVAIVLIINNNKKNNETSVAKCSLLPLVVLLVRPTNAIIYIIILSVVVLVLLAGIVYLVLKNNKAKKVQDTTDDIAEVQVEEINEESKPQDAKEVVKEEVKETLVENTKEDAVVLDTKLDNSEDTLVLDTQEGYYVTRYVKTFKAKLHQVSDVSKVFYSAIKNKFLSYGFKDRISNKFETFRLNDIIMRLDVRGKTLVLYSSIDAKEFADTANFSGDITELKDFLDTPHKYKIKSRRSCNYVLKLVNNIAKKYNLKEVERQIVDYSKDFKYETTAYLIALKEAKEVYVKVNYKPKSRLINLSEAEEKISDSDAKNSILECDIVSDKTVKTEVSLETLSKYFKESDIIDIESMKKVIPDFKKDATYVKIDKANEIDKKFTIIADEFNLKAVKMIVLNGGKVYKKKV